MRVIICLDDNGGMLFNNRRQSRDKEVLKDIVDNLNGVKLRIAPFSEKLFADYSENVIVDDAFLTEAGENDICFVENQPLKDFSCISEIVAYKWNRLYPSDFKCDIDFSRCTLVDSVDFKGFSHEKITKETYKLKGDFYEE